uniref:Uncharacterized protein n=1 Tax=Attheya septentrionalis TaxID=420275 RepID=A0A7S2ULF9_9STRA
MPKRSNTGRANHWLVVIAQTCENTLGRGPVERRLREIDQEITDRHDDCCYAVASLRDANWALILFRRWLGPISTSLAFVHFVLTLRRIHANTSSLISKSKI